MIFSAGQNTAGKFMIPPYHGIHRIFNHKKRGRTLPAKKTAQEEHGMIQLTEEKPVIFFDLETTGTNIQIDRIVEISLVKIFPDGKREIKTRRLNPEMHIPEESSAVHHIYDEDVAHEPTFRQISNSLLKYMDDCDLGGYNIGKFDIPVLIREFARAGLTFNMDGRRIVDAYTVFCRMEPRTLSGAYRFYCGKKMEDAHSAEADILATVEVYENQLKRYSSMPEEEIRDLVEKFPETIDEMHQFCIQTQPGSIDQNGRFKWRNNEAVIAFGRHNGETLRNVAIHSPDFLRWILKGDFPDDVKKIASDALQGVFPQKN